LTAGFVGADLANATLAAVFGQVAQEAIHAWEISAVDQIPALLLDRHQAGMGQFLEMKRQGVARHAQVIGQDAGREPFRAGDDQGAEGAQALGVGQGGQCEDCLIFSHIYKFNYSTIFE
jgi:hypothetical protein